MVKDKCAVVITHRLSAVQLADKVAVFDDGQVIEYGTHTDYQRVVMEVDTGRTHGDIPDENSK